MSDDQDLAKEIGCLKYVLIFAAGLSVGGILTMLLGANKILPGYSYYQLNVYNRQGDSSYSIWDYRTHLQIYTFPFGKLPDLDSAIEQNEHKSK